MVVPYLLVSPCPRWLYPTCSYPPLLDGYSLPASIPLFWMAVPYLLSVLRIRIHLI